MILEHSVLRESIASSKRCEAPPCPHCLRNCSPTTIPKYAPPFFSLCSFPQVSPLYCFFLFTFPFFLSPYTLCVTPLCNGYIGIFPGKNVDSVLPVARKQDTQHNPASNSFVSPSAFLSHKLALPISLNLCIWQGGLHQDLAAPEPFPLSRSRQIFFARNFAATFLSMKC